jgi:hypothetical protein
MFMARNEARDCLLPQRVEFVNSPATNINYAFQKSPKKDERHDLNPTIISVGGPIYYESIPAILRWEPLFKIVIWNHTVTLAFSACQCSQQQHFQQGLFQALLSRQEALHIRLTVGTPAAFSGRGPADGFEHSSCFYSKFG